MGHISPHTAVRFSGMYKIVPPAGKEASLPVMLNAPPIKEHLSQLMYAKDHEKGELKNGDPLRSAFFIIRDMVIGFTGNDALAISAKMHEKAGKPEGAALSEVQSRLVTQNGGDLYKRVAVSAQHAEEAYDEYVQSQGKPVEEIKLS
jgi:hypothetical protein